jgi:hypothetical protein
VSLQDETMHEELRRMAVVELQRRSQPGWPRWMVPMQNGRRYPMPWINAISPVFYGLAGFTRMDLGRVQAANDDGLCFCCGLPLERVICMGRYAGAREDTDEATFEHEGKPVYLTDGPPGHPRCVALAAQHCPHLRRDDGLRRPTRDGIVAFAYEGRRDLACLEVPLKREERELPDGTMAEHMRPRVVNPRARRLSREELSALASSDPMGRG